MSHIQVKDVPTSVHAELRRRAAKSGKSIREHVLELIRRDLALPSREDWLAAAKQLTPVQLGGPASELIREGRSERGGRR